MLQLQSYSTTIPQPPLNSTETFVCDIYGGLLPVQYTLKFPSGDEVKSPYINSYTTEFLVHISNVLSYGKYSCISTNEEGSAVESLTLSKPGIILSYFVFNYLHHDIVGKFF